MEGKEIVIGPFRIVELNIDIHIARFISPPVDKRPKDSHPARAELTNLCQVLLHYSQRIDHVAILSWKWQKDNPQETGHLVCVLGRPVNNKDNVNESYKMCLALPSYACHAIFKMMDNI